MLYLLIFEQYVHCDTTGRLDLVEHISPFLVLCTLQMATNVPIVDFCTLGRLMSRQSMHHRSLLDRFLQTAPHRIEILHDFIDLIRFGPMNDSSALI